MNIGFPSAVPAPSLAEVTRQKVIGNDHVAKEKMRCYADKRRNTREHDLEVGDTVVVKNTDRRKMDPPYHPDAHVIVAKKGDMVTATNGDRNITRNNAHFKKLHERNQGISTTDVQVPPTPVVNTRESEMVAMDTADGDSTDPITTKDNERPKRTRRVPEKLKDFVHYEPK